MKQHVNQSELDQLYKDIPIDAYKFIANSMGYARPNKVINILIGRHQATVKSLNKIKAGFEKWRSSIFSTKNKNGEFDIWQHTIYYKGLNDFINSEDYKILPPYKRDKILEEQQFINKQIK